MIKPSPIPRSTKRRQLSLWLTPYSVFFYLLGTALIGLIYGKA